MKAILATWTPDWPPECTGQRITVKIGGTPVIDNDTLGPTVASYPVDFTPGAMVVEVRGYNEATPYSTVKTASVTVPAAISVVGSGVNLEETDV